VGRKGGDRRTEGSISFAFTRGWQAPSRTCLSSMQKIEMTT